MRWGGGVGGVGAFMSKTPWISSTSVIPHQSVAAVICRGCCSRRRPNANLLAKSSDLDTLNTSVSRQLQDRLHR